jgi:hypothetical protein
MQRREASAALSRVPEAHSGEARKPRKRTRASKYIGMRQASNIMEAVSFAKSIGLPLVAHLTIHWSLTDIGDDPEGKLFAKVREGLHKWLDRHGIVFAAAWARERQCRGQSDVEHCHLLFHLPVEYRSGKRLARINGAILRLVRLHGDGIFHENAIDIRIHSDPDGKYLIKGGGPKVWKKFRLRKEHRRLQGNIHGKRCGVTENIGPAARNRAANSPTRVPVCAAKRTNPARS